MGDARRGFAAVVVAGVLIALSAGPASWAADATLSEESAAGANGTVRIEPAPADGLTAEAESAVAALSVRERAASVVMGHIPTTDPVVLRDYMASSGIGGFILMGANIPSDEDALREVTAALTLDPTLPPLIAIDQEGGDVSRLPWDQFPSSVTLKDEPPAAAQDAFAARAALVQRAGIGVNFGVVADETDDPNSFIYRRALGTTPESAAERVAAAVTGEADAAMSTLKHFPGHGAAPGDSHQSIPSTDMTKAAWQTTDGVPFQSGIEAGAPLLMFGHLAYTAVDAAPASLSAEWHRIAREELGFQGLAVTDDLGMLEASGDERYADPVANAVSALAAGNDLVLGVMFSDAQSATRIVDGIVAAVESGALPGDRLDDAATRVMAMRMGLAADGRGLMPCGDCEAVG